MPRWPQSPNRAAVILQADVTVASSAEGLEIVAATKGFRVLRIFALNGTATGQLWVERGTAVLTGGTSAAVTPLLADTTQPAATVSAKSYTAAATGGGGTRTVLMSVTTGTTDRLPFLDNGEALNLTVNVGQTLILTNKIASAHVYRFTVLIEEL